MDILARNSHPEYTHSHMWPASNPFFRPEADAFSGHGARVCCGQPAGQQGVADPVHHKHDRLQQRVARVEELPNGNEHSGTSSKCRRQRNQGWKQQSSCATVESAATRSDSTVTAQHSTACCNTGGGGCSRGEWRPQNQAAASSRRLFMACRPRNPQKGLAETRCGTVQQFVRHGARATVHFTPYPVCNY